MASVGGCSVRSVWIGMGTPSLVLTAGLNSQSTLKTTEVSAEKLVRYSFTADLYVQAKEISELSK